MKRNMKKKIRILLLGGILFLSFAACNKAGKGEGKGTPTPSWRDNFAPSESTPVLNPSPTSAPRPILKPIDSVGTYVPKEGQQKLVVLTSGSANCTDVAIRDRVNELLEEKGYPFYVSFLPQEDRYHVSDKFVSEYSQGWCEQYICSGNQVDLVMSPVGNAGVPFIQNGMLLPIKDYPEPERDKILALYPEIYWKLNSFRGECYGIPSNVRSFLPNGFLMNVQVAENLGISLQESEYISYSKMEDYLEQAFQQGYIPVYANDSVVTAMGCASVRNAFVKTENGTIRFVNPVADAESLSNAKAFCSYRRKGWLFMDESLQGGQSKFTAETVKKALFWKSNFRDVSAYTDGLYRNPDILGDRTVRVKWIAGGKEYVSENFYAGIMGISVFSKNREYAAQLLALLYTDEDIIKVLRYGVEGVHYTVENGVRQYVSYVPGSWNQLGNDAVFFEDFPDEDQYEKLGNALEEVYENYYILVPYLELNQSQEQILAEGYEIIAELNEFILATEEELDRKITDIAERLEIIGYNRVVEELNRNMQER